MRKSLQVFRRRGTGRDWSSWPVLLLLLTALVPSAGVVWMLRAALENERLAVRQRLAEAYRVQLESCQQEVAQDWQRTLVEMEKVSLLPESPAEKFRRCIESIQCDGVVVRDGSGAVIYPNASQLSGDVPADPQWRRAAHLEFSERNPAAAAVAYQRFADGVADERQQGMAEQAAARCLLRVGDEAGGKAILNRMRARVDVTDAHGRSLAADAELRLLEIAALGSAEAEELAKALQARLSRYADSDMPADQRRFLMHRASELAPEHAAFSMLAREDLTAAVLAGSSPLARGPELRETAIDGVWSITTADGRLTALFRTESLQALAHRAVADQRLPSGVGVTARTPGRSTDDDELMAASLRPYMPGWRLSMQLDGGDVLDEAASARRTWLLSIATVLVGATLVLTWFVANGVRRQMQVARLKNDLVATVSHELKTPLASMRLLIDTLLDEEFRWPGMTPVDGQTREYLEMISHENARLSRLIDNFLTFSRMERGKHRFEFSLIDGRGIIERAAMATADRFDGVGAKLQAEVGEALWMRGDMEALVTAVINLIDNAWKYSGEEKVVRVRGRLEGERVFIDVTDNGVGLTPRAARRVFERFYQVDQQLSRTRGGCGLGLSIVKSIVEAHGGQTTVESRLGEGSVFTISLPAISAAERAALSVDWSLKRPVRSGEERGE